MCNIQITKFFGVIKNIVSTYVMCSNEMSRMSANLISRKQHKHAMMVFDDLDFFFYQSIL